MLKTVQNHCRVDQKPVEKKRTLSFAQTANSHQASSGPYFFDRIQEPSFWEALSDEALVQLYQQTQDRMIICILMQRYRAAIIGMSMKYFRDTESVQSFSHDLFEKMANKFLTVEVKHFEFYLCSMIRNMHADHARKAKKQEKVLKSVQQNDDTDISSSSLAEEENERELVLTYLKIFFEVLYVSGELQDYEYQSIQYRCFEGLKPAAIAAKTQLDIGEVYRGIENGKKKLKKYLNRLKLTPELLACLQQSEILSKEESECLRLNAFQQASPSEISSQLQLSHSLVCKHLHQARWKLNKIMSFTKAFVMNCR